MPTSYPVQRRATTCAAIIAETKARGYRRAALVDACRWAMQDAGIGVTAREQALVDAGLITVLGQDFGALLEEFSPRPMTRDDGTY